MSEVPIGRGLLDRDVTDRMVNRATNAGLLALQRITDEGETILRKIIESRSAQDRVGMIVASHLFVHFLTELDGTEVLLSRACTYAAKSTLRAMIESSAYTHWILKEDSDDRATRYYVGHCRSQLRIAKKELDMASTEDSEFWKDAIQEARTAISSPSLAETNALFDQETRRDREPAWYSVAGGPKYMKQLMDQAGMDKRLGWFWERFSDFTHGATYSLHTWMDSKKLMIDPIRDPRGLHRDTRMAMHLALQMYELICRKWLPSHLAHLKRRARRWSNDVKSMTPLDLHPLQ